MIYNYLKVAFRTFFKNRVFTAITLSGLSLGICCFILLFLYVRHDLSFDHYHENKDRIYRVLIRQELPETSSVQYGGYFDPALLESFKTNTPSLLHATRFQSSTWNWVKHDTKMRIDAIGYVDPDFLEMFTFPLLVGDRKTALSEPNGIILTVDLVNFFFGEQNGNYSNILGRVVTLPASIQKDFVVTGVIDNVPENSIFRFSVLTPFDTWQDMGASNDRYGTCHMFMEVDSPKSVPEIERSVGATLMSFYKERIEVAQMQGQLAKSDHCVGAWLQPLTDIYFGAEGRSYYLRSGNIWYSIILSGIASLILLIACINAVTIQLGQATVRSREVGIRKVVGARQSQLIGQFFTEAGILCMISVVLAIVLAEMLLPAFNHFAGKHLDLTFADSGQTIGFIFASMAFVTLIIGGFPSLVMSRFSPLVVMKFQKPTQGRTLFANGLVVIQYTITIILFFATFVMHRQIQYVRNKDTGFEREGVMVLSLPTEITDERKELFKARLKTIPSVLNVAGSDRNFTFGMSNDLVETPYGDRVVVRTIRVDEDYLDTLKISLIDGTNFPANVTSDRNHMALVNQKMVERFRWEQPVGQIVRFGGWEFQVIGVVNDFHIDSMRSELSPLILNMGSNFNGINYHLIRYEAGRANECRAAIERIWNEYEPDREIGLHFLDSILEEQYENDARWNRITIYASTLAIMLSCMGLWGITALAVDRRTKEIGIRKVLGSGEAGIWKLFSADLLRLFVISFVIAVPVAYYTMQRWLDFFAYHIGIPWQAYAQAALICLALSMLTISWLVIRAAGNNPVESLRYE